MSGLPPTDRRGFFAGAGGALICTLAGQKIFADSSEVDLTAAVSRVEEPPKVRAAGGPVAIPAVLPASAAAASSLPPVIGGLIANPSPGGGGVRREYWIRAEQARQTIVPKKRDEMMNRRIKGKTKFTAYCYRAYDKDFGKPLARGAMPGPVLEANVGDTLVVNFQNRLPVPVTMHPHGVFYRPEMDGAYKGKYTDPGGFVKPGKTFQYVWDARADSVGVWPYHDHGPMDAIAVFKGLFGALHIRDPAKPKPDVEHYIFLHSLLPPATGLNAAFQCINGRAYTGNTPTLRAKVGQKVAQYVIGMSNDFHTYHVHGHRWKDDAGRLVDNQTLGPADSLLIEFTEDNPGRWFYHCHVFSHLATGMSGWYFVDP